MKKLILLALVSILVAGCRYEKVGDNTYEASNSIVVIDSHTGEKCEYYPDLGHKGNCKFCVERRKQEQKELIQQIIFLSHDNYK